MANLKQDILNSLGNDKYYAEHELSRLAQDPNTYYKGKVADMVGYLKELASVDLAFQLVEKYFAQPEAPAAPASSTDGAEQPAQPADVPAQPADAPAQPAQPVPHQGQSHAEG